MGELYLESRLDFLRNSQNLDGGWGYFTGKQSWLEPTTYAMLALDGTKNSEARLDSAWKLVRSWQTPEGSSRPTGQVSGGTWITAHVVTLACVRKVYDDSVRSSVDWMLRVSGAESTLTNRVISQLHIIKTKMDFSHKGWPWREGNASWIEPTAHSLVALKKVASQYRGPELQGRVREGEALILSRRCTDGGWNCGNPNTLNFDLPSYPETTGIALLGLQGSEVMDMKPSLALAEKYWRETTSPLAKAWLAIPLRNYGLTLPDPDPGVPATPDILLTALLCLACKDGGHQFLRAEGKT